MSVLLCRRLVLPPTAVTLLPNEDSWSARAKQFLSGDSFLRRGSGKPKKRSAGAQSTKEQGEEDSHAGQPPPLDTRTGSTETEDVMGASPRSNADPGDFAGGTIGQFWGGRESEGAQQGVLVNGHAAADRGTLDESASEASVSGTAAVAAGGSCREQEEVMSPRPWGMQPSWPTY